MIKLIYMNNIERKLIKEISTEELKGGVDVQTSILKSFKDAGYQNAVDREKLLTFSQGKREGLKSLEDMSGKDIVICYADTVNPKSAVKIECKNGINYYIQTKEKCHKFNPHIHAECQGEEVSVYLETLKIKGKMKSKDLKKVQEYVMEHRKELLEIWEEYHDT